MEVGVDFLSLFLGVLTLRLDRLVPMLRRSSRLAAELGFDRGGFHDAWTVGFVARSSWCSLL